MNIDLKQTKWSENVVIVDADYVDRVAFNLSVNFERMLMRRVPKADLARWIDCVALDGGVREGDHETHVIMVHEAETKEMENFIPSSFSEEMNGKAFKDNLGEFAITAVEVPQMADKDSLMLEILRIAMSQPEVKRIMAVPNAEDSDIYARMRRALASGGDEKTVTLFAMQPLPGGRYRQEILGYSLMAALGIRADEIKAP
jgi:hypothetical protein